MEIFNGDFQWRFSMEIFNEKYMHEDYINLSNKDYMHKLKIFTQNGMHQLRRNRGMSINRTVVRLGRGTQINASLEHICSGCADVCVDISPNSVTRPACTSQRR